MRGVLAALVCGAALAGCASAELPMKLPFRLPWQAEPFAGRYRVADPKDRTVVQIRELGPGRWDMRYDQRDAPLGGELVAATREQLKGWLSDDRQADEIRCLATHGRSTHPVVCAVPKDVPLTFVRKGTNGRAAVSRTGWVLVAPAGGGLAFGDLEREP